MRNLCHSKASRYPWARPKTCPTVQLAEKLIHFSDTKPAHYTAEDLTAVLTANQRRLGTQCGVGKTTPHIVQ